MYEQCTRQTECQRANRSQTPHHCLPPSVEAAHQPGSPAPCPPWPRVAFGALPPAPPLLSSARVDVKAFRSLGGRTLASSWSTSQGGLGQGVGLLENRGSINYRSVVLSSPHPHPTKTYWAGKPSTLTTRLAEQVKSRVETDFLFRAFGTQAVVRTISNPHQIVVRIRPT